MDIPKIPLLDNYVFSIAKQMNLDINEGSSFMQLIEEVEKISTAKTKKAEVLQHLVDKFKEGKCTIEEYTVCVFGITVLMRDLEFFQSAMADMRA